MVSEYEDFLISIADKFVHDLYELGSRKIGIVGLPPIGCVPLERTINFAAFGQCREEMDDAARGFTVKQQQLVARLDTELSGLTLMLGNVFNLGIDVISNPSAYGECSTTNVYNFLLI
jgi:hypothetical protein